MKFSNTVLVVAAIATSDQVLAAGPHQLDNGNSWSQLFTYHIQMEDADLKFLQDDPVAEIYKPCNVTVYSGGDMIEENRVLTSIGAGCRYKGSAGSFFGCVGSDGKQNRTGWCRNLSWKVNAHKFASNYPCLDKQPRFDGADKLVLQGIQGDTSLMGEISAWHHMKEIGGTPAARCNNANVYVNNIYEGLYNHLENIDEDFVEARWGKEGVKGGALLKHMWFRPKSSSAKVMFSAESGFDGKDVLTKIREDCVECQKQRGGCSVTRAKEILKNVDMDSFIRGFIIASVTHNYDTAPYAFFGTYIDKDTQKPYNELTVNNFFMFIEEKTEKLFFIPWDYTESLTHEACSSGFCEVGEFGNYSTYDNFQYAGDLQEDLPEELCKANSDLFPEEKDSLHLSYPACEPVLYTMGKAWGEEYKAAFKQFIDGIATRQESFTDSLKVSQTPYVKRHGYADINNKPDLEEYNWAYKKDPTCGVKKPEQKCIDKGVDPDAKVDEDCDPCNIGFRERLRRTADALYQVMDLDQVTALTDPLPIDKFAAKTKVRGYSKLSGQNNTCSGKGQSGTGTGTGTGSNGKKSTGDANSLSLSVAAASVAGLLLSLI